MVALEGLGDQGQTLAEVILLNNSAINYNTSD